ncbi:hypothetical protein [Novosphingobium sp. Fuku2-ISO-50]|uniref:hypothetical protein n=1 Tax=Novosphingobium sp. Fuku2-ISO-50 TaxID=1739114 RepID=UPI00076BEC9A|nr:hypothetical protein [Novosphingobium sp. Fuku2-ISO-50]KUR75291.1 hypothetical protein AQZ50_15625 [Novosphingobium sp. Fuku2-ISO-50]
MPLIPAFPEHADLVDIDAFLASETGSAWIARLAGAMPHTRYWRDRSDFWPLKQLNALAARIIDAHYEGQDVECAMEAEFPPAEFGDTWHHEIAPHLRDQLDAVGIGDTDGEIRAAIRSAWDNAAADRDDSRVADLFASHDRCELLFRFSTAQWPVDSLIHSHKPWPEPSALSVTRNLQLALSNLGYTITEFRKRSKNRHPAAEYLQRSARRRRAPIVTWDQLNELIENACSTSFLFCLNAIVPIPDLIALDLGKPVTFDKCWVASLDPVNGTFQDAEANGPVRVRPEDGRFLSGGHLRWSPENICALYPPFYHASVRNAELCDSYRP